MFHLYRSVKPWFHVPSYEEAKARHRFTPSNEEVFKGYKGVLKAEALGKKATALNEADLAGRGDDDDDGDARSCMSFFFSFLLALLCG